MVNIYKDYNLFIKKMHEIMKEEIQIEIQKWEREKNVCYFGRNTQLSRKSRQNLPSGD